MTTEAVGSAFGRSLASRVRPRSSSVVRRREHRPFVGAVGRASVGFGRAVGRAQAIRPVIGRDDLNTSALRPPTGFWRDEIAELVPTTESGAAAAPGPTSPVVRRTAAAHGPTWTDRMLAGSTSRPSSARRTGTVAASTATATAQASTGDPKLDSLRRMLAGEPEPEPEPEADRRRPASSNRTNTRPERLAPTSADGIRGDTSAGVGTGPGRLAERMRPEQFDGSPPRPIRRRGSRFARSADEVSRPGGRGTDRRAAAPPPSPGMGPGDARDTVRRSPGGASSRQGDRSGRRRQQSQPTRLDALREMLESHGDLPPSPGPEATGTTTGPRNDGVSWASDRTPFMPSMSPSGTDAARTVDRPADQQISRRHDATPPTAESNGGRITPRPAVRIEGDLPVRRPPGAISRPDAPSPLTTNDRVSTESAPSTSTSSTWSPSPGESPADSLRRARQQAIRRQRAHPNDSDESQTSTITALLSDEPTTPVGDATEAGNVLLRTPLSTGLQTATDPLPVALDAVETGASTIRTSSSISDIAADDPIRRMRRPVLPGAAAYASSAGDEITGVESVTGTRSVTEALPRSARTGVDARRAAPMGTTFEPVLRRVTLPRAMSSTHRPMSRLAAVRPTPGSAALSSVVRPTERVSPGPAARPLTGSTGRVDRDIAPASDLVTQTLTTSPPLARALRTDAAARATPAMDGGLSSPTRGSEPRRQPGADAVPSEPFTHRPSVLPAGPGALLEAVRRTVDRQNAHTAARPGPQRTEEREGSTTQVSAAELPEAPPLARQFMTELAQTIRRKPAPLPTPFQPMADAITGGRQVMLSTDAASRRALRSVGKVAATTGDVIHLDRQPTPGARINEVIAHELTHIAHPSPVPRFFDDIDHSPEERKADQVAQIMARSPLAPTASVVAPTSGTAAPARDRTIRRSLARSSGSGGISAEALAERIEGGSSSSGTGTIRRWADAQPSGARPSIGGHRPTPAPAEPAPAPEPPSIANLLDSDAARAWLDEELDRRVNALLQRIEDRMIIDLERRGGRTWGGN